MQFFPRQYNDKKGTQNLVPFFVFIQKPTGRFHTHSFFKRIDSYQQIFVWNFYWRFKIENNIVNSVKANSTFSELNTL